MVSKREDLPTEVYLVTADTEWPVTVIVNDNDGIIASRVADAVQRRRQSANVLRPEEVRVWRARIADPVEVDFTPATVVPASLRERDPDGATP